MAPGVRSAATLFLIGAFWSQVSGEASFLSESGTRVVSSGSSAALSEDGYRQVASLKNDEQMHKFVSRVLYTEGFEASPAHLSGFVPWYSGTRAVQSLKQLREELFAMPWVSRIFATDPAPVAAKSEAATPDLKAKPKAKSGTVAQQVQSKAKQAAAAPAAVAAEKSMRMPSPADLLSENGAHLAGWVTVEVPHMKHAVKKSHSNAKQAAAAVDKKSKRTTKPGKAAHPHATHSTANRAVAAPEKKTTRKAKPGIVAHTANSATTPAAAAPAAVATDGKKKMPSALAVHLNKAADLADWVVTEATPKAKPGVDAPATAAAPDKKTKSEATPSVAAHPVHRVAKPAVAAPAAVAPMKSMRMPSLVDLLSEDHANLTGWVTVEVPHTKNNVTSQAVHVLAKANQSQLAHMEHQSQLVSTKPHVRSLSWIAQQAQQSASKMARDMGIKLSKPILVMKDLAKLHAEDLERFFESIETTSVLLEAVDGSIKVLGGSQVKKLFNLTKELEHKEPQELFSMMASKGVKCKNCTLQEQLNRVIATWDWPAITRSASKASKEREQTNSGKIASTSGTCKSNCYAGKHAMASWMGQKCKWKNCVGCPECGSKGGSEGKVANKKEDVLVRICNAKCYAGKHADLAWASKKCHFRNCKGCPECDAKSVEKSVRPKQKTEVANHKLHDHGRPIGQFDSFISREAKKSQPHLSELAVDTAMGNAGTVVGDVTKSTARSDTVAENTGMVVSDVAKSTALSVEEAMQGASKAASSIFSKFLGFFGHADEIVSGDDDELKSARQAVAKEEKQKVKKATTPTKDKKKAPHKSKVKIATTPSKNKMTNFLAKPVQAKKEAEAVTPQKSARSKKVSEHVEAIPKAISKAQPPPNASATAGPEIEKAHKSKMHKLLQAAESANVADVADGNASLETAVNLQKRKASISETRLPGMPALLENSTQVFEVLNKQIGTLRGHLAEAKSESEKVIASKKVEYEGTLQQQHEETKAMKKMNKELNREVANLMKANGDIRTHATKLKDRGSELRKQISDLQAKISVAQEYLAGTLANTSSDSEKMNVLRELDEKDALQAKSEEHASALKQVSRVALLQFGSTAEPSEDPLEVVRILGGRFDDLDREEAASLDALKIRFEEQFNEEAQKQAALKKEGDELQKSKDGQLALREKLRDAVTYLEQTESFLTDQIKGLQAYALRLAS